MVVLSVIVGVIYDGKVLVFQYVSSPIPTNNVYSCVQVHLAEAVLFPIVYVLYVVAVLVISFSRVSDVLDSVFF